MLFLPGGAGFRGSGFRDIGLRGSGGSGFGLRVGLRGLMGSEWRIREFGVERLRVESSIHTLTTCRGP